MTLSPQKQLQPFASLAQCLASGFGVGCMRKAPGTWGTVLAVFLWWIVALSPYWVYVATTVLLCAVGVWICGQAARELAVHDHGGIVWDEIAGFFITMLMVPHNLWWALVGFVLFRFFDIVKPWPISWVDQQVDGGVGIMLDDILAGILAGLLMWLLHSYGVLLCLSSVFGV